MKSRPPWTSVSSAPAEPGVAPPDAPPETPSDASPPSGRSQHRRGAVVTRTLVATNILIWLATVFLSRPTSLGDWLGLAPGTAGIGTLIALGAKDNDAIFAGEYWRLITAVFLHGGFLHLAMNNLALMMLGTTVERIYGPARFFVLYLFSGICGSILSYKFSPHLGVGASGAILGLAGVIIVFTVRYRPIVQPRFRREVRSGLLPLVLLQLVIGFAWTAMDAMAHLGGFLAGCLLATLVETPLAGRYALARERLPVGMALITGLLLLGYTGFSAAANVHHKLPALRAPGPQQWTPVVEAFRAVVRRRPNLIEPRLQLADALLRSGAWAEAAQQCREILELDNNHEGARRVLGLVLVEMRQWNEAVEVLEQAVRRAPMEWRLRMALAIAFAETDRAQEAVPIYRDLLRERPDDPEILNALAYHYADGLNSHIAEAIEMARRAVQLRPAEGSFWDTLGWAYYKNGQLEEAITAQERAVQLAGKHAEVRYHMGVVYQARGRREAALAEYRAALQNDPELAAARTALRGLEAGR